jgi:transcriptional regulator
MLIHPWDAPLDDDEWRRFLVGRDFGHLAASTPDGGYPLVVPTHFVLDGMTVLVHLARPNPIWKVVGDGSKVTLVVTDDYAFIPGVLRAAEGIEATDGVPTSYYSSVQLDCTVTLVTDPQQAAELLAAQLAHFQPAGDHAAMSATDGPYAKMLPGIRAARLTIDGVRAKFKYDDHKPRELQERTSAALATRESDVDRRAGQHQQARLAARDAATPS